MAMKVCEAIVEFRLNTPDQLDGVKMVTGQQFLYDGFRAKVANADGTERVMIVPNLKKTAGEWYVEISDAPEEPVSHTVAATQAAPKVTVTPEQKSAVMEELRRQGLLRDEPIRENSQPGGDGPKQDLNSLVNDYEKKTAKGSVIIDDDANEVMKTKDASNEGNKPGVQVEEKDTEKRRVIAEDQRLAKETKYTESSEPEARKKPEIVSDGEGVVVKKTGTPAVNKNDVSTTRIDQDGVVTPDGNVALETNYQDESEPTQVGTSTQTRLTKTQRSKSAANDKQAKARKATVQDVQDQDGQVVGKVRKSPAPKTSDGITVKTTVGASDEMSVPEAITSSNDAAIIGGEATIGSGSDRASEVGSGDDIDIGDLLADA